MNQEVIQDRDLLAATEGGLADLAPVISELLHAGDKKAILSHLEDQHPADIVFGVREVAHGSVFVLFVGLDLLDVLPVVVRRHQLLDLLRIVRLDLDDPSIIIGRCQTPLLSPREVYERIGDINNVVFACGAIVEDDNQIKIYYGAADSYVGLAFTTVDDIVAYIKEHSVVTEEDTEIGIR